MQDLFTSLPDADPCDRSDQRRAGGVFFTPPAVVRYIVHHTLGPLLDAHRDKRPLRILEPSCGQGVFLAEAFRYLRERHLYNALRRNLPFPVTSQDALEVVRITEIVKQQNPRFPWIGSGICC